METLYKITDTGDCTRQGTKWGVNVTHKKYGKDHRLCSDTVLHAYRTKMQALLMNEVGAYQFPLHLWKAVGKVVVEGIDKVGCCSLTTLKRLPVPKWAMNDYLATEMVSRVDFILDNKVRHSSSRSTRGRVIQQARMLLGDGVVGFEPSLLDSADKLLQEVVDKILKTKSWQEFVAEE
jgi:hypothetical protein